MTIEALRRDYARQVVAAAGVAHAALERAFAAVAREDYLCRPPWQVHENGAARPTSTSDPRRLYQDALVSLAPGRHVNNGQPSLHARCLAALRPSPGESAVHVGAGTGYYTAILAELLAPGGHVEAYEIDAELALTAAGHFAGRRDVVVHATSGTETALPAADIVYVSAGATHPVPAWLDALSPGGRLLFPLTSPGGFGAMLLAEQRTPALWAARFVERVAFVDCEGARDEAEGSGLASALQGRQLDAVRSLRRGVPPDGTAWYAGRGWWLSTAAAG